MIHTLNKKCKKFNPVRLLGRQPVSSYPDSPWHDPDTLNKVIQSIDRRGDGDAFRKDVQAFLDKIPPKDK